VRITINCNVHGEVHGDLGDGDFTMNLTVITVNLTVKIIVIMVKSP